MESLNYIRYRWGNLTCGYDDNLWDAVEYDRLGLEIGGEYDGTMSTSEMIKHLEPYIDFGGIKLEET